MAIQSVERGKREAGARKEPRQAELKFPETWKGGFLPVAVAAGDTGHFGGTEGRVSAGEGSGLGQLSWTGRCEVLGPLALWCTLLVVLLAT